MPEMSQAALPSGRTRSRNPWRHGGSGAGYRSETWCDDRCDHKRIHPFEGVLSAVNLAFAAARFGQVAGERCTAQQRTQYRATGGRADTESNEKEGQSGCVIRAAVEKEDMAPEGAIRRAVGPGITGSASTSVTRRRCSGPSSTKTRGRSRVDTQFRDCADAGSADLDLFPRSLVLAHEPKDGRCNQVRRNREVAWVPEAVPLALMGCVPVGRLTERCPCR